MAFFYSAPAAAEKPRRRRQGRQGQDHPNALFSEQQVIAIKRQLASGVPAAQIARDYAVSNAVIRHIKAGRTWSHVQLED